MQNKRWWKSLTIDSCIITIALVLVSAWMVASIKPLRYDFTTEELCDWAYATSRNQKIIIVQMLIISSAIVGIYGRLRAKKRISKNETKE